MSVVVSTELFAKLAGRNLDRATYLFEVSESLLEMVDSGEWSPPVSFRFVKQGDGALLEMEMRTPPATFYERLA